MKFAAIADIHGNLLALEAVPADIAQRGISKIVNLGDLLSGPLWPAETADRLRALNLPTIFLEKVSEVVLRRAVAEQDVIHGESSGRGGEPDDVIFRNGLDRVLVREAHLFAGQGE